MKNSAYLHSELRKREVYFKIATFTAFLASSLFIVGFFAGNIKFWTWDSDQWPYGLLGILITLAVTGFQRTLYSQGDIEAGKKMTWFAFFLSFAFGMMTEVGGGMEREEARMLDKSVNSPVFQNLMSNIDNLTDTLGNNPYAARIADAEAKKSAHELELGRCDRHADKGEKRVERCRVYEQKRIDAQQSKIDAYQQLAQGSDESRNQALSNTLSQAKQFERDEQNHHPLIKLIKDWFAVSPIFASFILSALIIGVFEYAFHYQGKSLAEIRSQFLDEGYDLSTGKAPQQEPTAQPPNSNHTTGQVTAPQPVPLDPLTTASISRVPSFIMNSSHYPPSPTQTPQQVGHTEMLNTPEPQPAPAQPQQPEANQDTEQANGIGYTAQIKTADADANAAPVAKDPAAMSAPEAKALLSTINNPKFDEVFVAVATGETSTAIGGASKKHGTGAEQVRNTLVCLEYCGLVSPKNENGQRTTTDTISNKEAEEVMTEIKKIIRGAAA